MPAIIDTNAIAIPLFNTVKMSKQNMEMIDEMPFGKTQSSSTKNKIKKIINTHT